MTAAAAEAAAATGEPSPSARTAATEARSAPATTAAAQLEVGTVAVTGGEGESEVSEECFGEMAATEEEGWAGEGGSFEEFPFLILCSSQPPFDLSSPPPPPPPPPPPASLPPPPPSVSAKNENK